MPQVKLPAGVKYRLPGGFHLPPFGIHQFLASIIVSVALWLAASFWLGVQAVEQWMGGWQQDVRYHVYLSTDLRERLDELAAGLRKLPGVQGVEVLPQEKAVEWIQGWLGGTGLSDAELAGRLPLSLEISPAPDADDQLFDEIRRESERFGGEVNESEVTLGKAHRWLQDVKRLLMYATLVMVLAMAMIISNTLRMSIVARADEVRLMRLLGAREWFVRLPFILEGVVLGAGAGLISWLLLWPLVMVSGKWLDSVEVHLDTVGLVLPLVASGGLIGCLGAVIATARIPSDSGEFI